MIEQLNGVTLDIAFPNDQRLIMRFNKKTVSYWTIENEEVISNRNDGIPFIYSKVRPGVYFIACHERGIGDLISMVVDFDTKYTYLTSLMGYPADDRRIRFDTGKISAILVDR